MMFLMMAGTYHKSAEPRLNKSAGKNFPPHMIGDPHEGHDRENQAQHRKMDRNGKDKRGDDQRAGERLDRMETHRRPSGGRAAGMVHGMGDAEQLWPVHPAVRPVEPRIMGEKIGEQ